MTFNEWVKGKNKANKIIIWYKGDDGLVELLKCIKSTANVGHSFDVDVDPKGDWKKGEKHTFGIDGDGADHILSIEVERDLDDESPHKDKVD